MGRFPREQHPGYRGCEDEIFIGKEGIEYFVNMVGSENMNWGLQADFQRTVRKAVLPPGCMRPNESKCQCARRRPDLACTRCNRKCSIARIDALGERHGFRVCIIPHSSTFSQWLERWRDSTEEGVVAVACLLNIVVGGYEMRELNIPSQCVLLDYCGCRKHWHETGIPTDLCDGRLLQVIGADR